MKNRMQLKPPQLILAWRSLQWQTSFLVSTQMAVVFRWVRKEAQEFKIFWKWKALIEWDTTPHPKGQSPKILCVGGWAFPPISLKHVNKCPRFKSLPLKQMFETTIVVWDSTDV